MAGERAAGGTGLVDVFDRVLDKGIVIEAWVGVSLVDIDLIAVDARIVVASFDTYLRHSSKSMLRTCKEDEDDDGGGEGSSGAPAMLQPVREPRPRPGPTQRTRRKPH